ncbi:unnamed protein product [Diamesa serratosioi]
MNLSISLILLISFSLIGADTTQEEFEETFMFVGLHETNISTYGTGMSMESNFKFQWFMSKTLKLNWDSAVDACKTHGLRLALIESDDNSKVLLRFLNNFDFVHNYYPRAYVGISKSAGNDTWIAAASSYPYIVNFKLDLKLEENVNKRCLIAQATSLGSEFIDNVCDEENHFICEKVEGGAHGSGKNLTLVQALPTQEEIDEHFVYIGKYEMSTKAQGTQMKAETKTEYEWFMSRKSKVNWSTAVAACKTFDMKLAEMESHSTSGALLDFFTNFFFAHRYLPRGFVGITKPSNSQTWYRASDNKKVSSNLVVAENINDNEKRCLIADENNFSGTSCNEKNYYICEKETSSAWGIK